MRIGEIIKYFRESNNLTQLDLATKFLVDEATIELWESGVSEPPLNKIEEISNYFNFDASSFAMDNIFVYHKVTEPTKESNLMFFRLYNHLDMEQVARALKISVSKYMAFEEDITNMPVNLVHRLANYYRTTIDELVGRKYNEWIDATCADSFRKLIELPIEEYRKFNDMLDGIHKKTRRFKRTKYRKIR